MPLLPPVELKLLCDRLRQGIEEIIRDYPLHTREDSRAFGASVEKIIKDRWPELCERLNLQSLEPGGRRTIYDVAFTYNRQNYGLDIRSKESEKGRYSDGGVCSLFNLLSLLEKQWMLLILEIEHLPDEQDKNIRKIKNLSVLPFHCLPEDIYRIENLGTGQIRFNYPLSKAYDRIEWDRCMDNFLDILLSRAKSHYNSVAKTAQERAQEVEQKVSHIKQIWNRLI